MVLDLLPYKHPQVERNPWDWLRYVTFALSLLYVGALFVFQAPGKERIMYSLHGMCGRLPETGNQTLRARK